MSERATKYDAMFLYSDNEVAEMQVAMASIAEGQIDPARYAEWVAPRIKAIPRLCQYPRFAPMNLRYPMWVDVPGFDPRDHIEHIEMPAPGTDEQLRDLLTERFHIRLDRTKPLWRMLLITGLEGNRSAMVFYVHHCICDGTSAMEIFKALYDDPSEEWPEHHHLKRAEPHAHKPLVPVRIIKALRSERSRDQLRHVWRYLKAPGPWFPFTRAVSGRVNFSWRDVPIDRLHDIRRSFGGTVTDVGLAALGGALDRYAQRQGMDVPGQYFKVALPENVRPAEMYGEMGNNVSVIPTLVPLGIADPAERLRQVTAYTRMAKEKRLGRCVHGVLSGLMDLIGPLGTAWLTKLLGSPTWIRFACRMVKTPREHAIVTSVQSPRGLVYHIDGLEVTRSFPMVPCGLALGVMCALIAYRDKLQVALTGDSATMPKIDELMDDFEAELEAMHGAVVPQRAAEEELPAAVGMGK
jgi:WS/DGAT/MGAT family acyltransferase